MVPAVDNWDVPVFAAAVVVGALILAHGLATVTDPVLVWGGTRCDVSHGIYACWGYAPAGLVLSIVIVTAVGAGVLTYVGGRRD